MNSHDAAALGRGPWIVLLFLALIVLVFTKSQTVSWADASRMGSIQGLVEHDTLALDETDYLYQGDKVRIGGPLSEGGHYYSHQPPMLALMASVPYRMLHWWGSEIRDPRTYQIITISVVGLPLLLGLFSLARLMRLAGARSGDVAWLIAAAGLGTLALPYSLVLNQHAPAAGFVMLGLLQIQRRRIAWAGLFFGLAATIDLTAAFLSAAMVLPIARAGGIFAIAKYAIAAFPLLALHFSINYAIAGDLMPFGLHTEAFEYAGSPFLLMDLTGGIHDSGALSFGSYVFGALFGSSGLFSHHPVLLFALAAGALVLFESYGPPSWRAETSAEPAAPGLAASIDHALLLGSFGICLYYLTQSRNFGGSSFGIRWFCVFAPTLMLLPAIWLGRRHERRLALWLFAPLLFWSLSAAAVGAVQPWTKISYRWQDTPYGKAALQRGETVSFGDHVFTQLSRASDAHAEYDRNRWQNDFQLLLLEHRRTYLLQEEGMTEEAHRIQMAAGLAKLERVVELFEKEDDHSTSRAWSHYWRAQFYRRLGHLEEAESDIEIVLELSPDFYRSQFFDRMRGRRLEQ